MPPSRTLWAMILLIMMTRAITVSQSLSSAQANAVAGFSPFSRGAGALNWNPAGLTLMKDWELTASYFYSPYASDRAYSLHTATVGKRFLPDHAAALQLSPGSTLEFVVPSTFAIGDSNASIISEYEKTISYSEKYGLGYAFRVAPDFSFGFTAKFYEENISDTKYTMDSNSVIRSSVINYTGNAWNINIGLLWNVAPDWILSAGCNGLFHVTESQLPDEIKQYKMETPKVLYGGLGYSGIKSLQIGVEADTKEYLRGGIEWTVTDALKLRGGIYGDVGENSSSSALALGAGTSYQVVRADISYLTFFNQTDRRGSVDLTRFEESGIDNIEFNRFTGDRVTLTLSVQLGKMQESLTRIEYVEMLNDVFPSSSAIHAFRPIGKARVRNVSAAPVQAKVGFYVSRFMDAPTETLPYTIPANGVIEIPFFAIFNEAVQAVKTLGIHDGEVFVTASTPEEYDDSYRTRVLVHGKNEWNGDVTMLKYFITPNDPDIRSFGRESLRNYTAHLDTVAEAMQVFEKAKILFNEFISGLVYVNDPKLSQDYVQYPNETMTLRGGDCDDMAVAYSTVLMSVGISTAFVDVVPPEKPEEAHIYMMFDTGLEPQFANRISENPKRFVIKKNGRGNETVWIPIETTVVKKGFETAWQAGAEEYFRDVEVNGGIIKGWVHVIDVQPVQ